MKKELVTLKNIHKSYIRNGSTHLLYTDFSFSVHQSEFVAIFGPNGCGKSTLLNLIAGIDTEYKGVIERKQNLNTSFVFQNYKESLFPWLSVRDNIAYPLRVMGKSEKECTRAVQDLCNRLAVPVPLSVYPYTLSGGQQQLVCILRALITKPDMLLMDEPFSALDYETTLFLMEKIQDIWRKTGVAIVFVSHEVDDAVSLAQRIVVFGRNPTRVMSEISDMLPYPRTSEVMNSELFHQIKNKVLTEFIKGYKNI